MRLEAWHHTLQVNLTKLVAADGVIAINPVDELVPVLVHGCQSVGSIVAELVQT